MGPILRHPTTGAAVDLSEHRLVASMVRLVVLGGDDFSLAFDDPRIVAVAAGLLSREPETVWDPELLQPVARRGLEILEQAAPADARLAALLGIWRPRALVAAGRGSELSGDDALRLRLEDRLEVLTEQIAAATEEGDDDRAQALHARYIELGTTYAARLARAL